MRRGEVCKSSRPIEEVRAVSQYRHAEQPWGPVSSEARIAGGPDAIGFAVRAARQEADRISFSDLGRRREEVARALPDGGELAAALAEDEIFQALLERRDALRRWQAELDGLADRTNDHAGSTPNRSDPGGPER